MLFRAHHRSRVLFTLVLAGVAATGAAKAATYTYALAADPGNVQTTSRYIAGCGCAYVVDDLSLINTATGTNSVPAITLNDGDTIDGTVSLSGPWTTRAAITGLPLPDVLAVSLQNIDGITVSGSMNESLSFFDKGVPVAIPPGFGFASGGSAQVVMGMAWFGGSPAFTFDQIDFSGTLIQPPLGDSSASLESASPMLSMEAYVPAQPPTAAPELDPASLGGALTLLGGALAVVRSRRARARGA